MKTSINFSIWASAKKRWIAGFISRPLILLLAITAVLILGDTEIRKTAFLQATETPNLDWPYYGNDLANSRYQNVDLINPSNVAQLVPAWVFHTGVLDPEASLEVSPIVVNGTIYVTSGHDDVFALDAATGQQ